MGLEFVRTVLGEKGFDLLWSEALVRGGKLLESFFGREGEKAIMNGSGRIGGHLITV